MLPLTIVGGKQCSPIKYGILFRVSVFLSSHYPSVLFFSSSDLNQLLFPAVLGEGNTSSLYSSLVSVFIGWLWSKEILAGGLTLSWTTGCLFL